MRLSYRPRVQSPHVALLVIGVALAGCLAEPTVDQQNEETEVGPEAELLGTVNITFRHPRNVPESSYEYELQVITPQNSTFSGTAFTRSGTDCAPPECIAWEEGVTGDFVPRGQEYGSTYPYLRTTPVAYLGNWTITITALRDTSFGVMEASDQECSHIAFIQVGLRPNEAQASPEIDACLLEGTYIVHYDGTRGRLASTPAR